MKMVSKIIALLSLILLLGTALTATAIAAGVTTDGQGRIQTTKDATTLISPIPGGPKTVPYDSLNGYINSIFIYGLGLAALLALAQLIFGSVQYTASAGVPSLQEDAKSRMRGAIIGLILLILSTAILTTLSGGDSFGLSNPAKLIADYQMQVYDEMSDKEFCDEVDALKKRKSNSGSAISSAEGNIREQTRQLSEIALSSGPELKSYEEQKKKLEGCVDMTYYAPGGEGATDPGKPINCQGVGSDGKPIPGGLAYDRAFIAWKQSKLTNPNLTEKEREDIESAIDGARRSSAKDEKAYARNESLHETFVRGYDERRANANSIIKASEATIAEFTKQDEATAKTLKDLESRISARCRQRYQ